MAKIKGWTKLNGIKHRWQSNFDQVDVGERRLGKWNVQSIYGYFEDSKWFTSESEAIKFARNYMRNHPRGK